MKQIYTLLITILMIISSVACSKITITPKTDLEKSKNIQNIQIFSTLNRDKNVTTKSIEDAFKSVGLTVPGNNDMNKPFKTRFKTIHYKIYNLAMYINNDLTFKLLKKYPSFGALTPLTMSIWEAKDGSMNIATLNINGMARAANIPLNDSDLVAYAALIKKGLHAAMPKGSFKKLNYQVKFPKKSLATNFVAQLELEGQSPEEFIEEFEAELEGELEPLGFLIPNYTDVQEEIFDKEGYKGVYDFYHTYSFCKFDVIYPVSKTHPEAGAWAPCSFYLYKKTGENQMHMGFLSVENWITTLDISDDNSTVPLLEAQGMIEAVVKDMIE